jgi:hypothetical protein
LISPRRDLRAGSPAPHRLPAEDLQDSSDPLYLLGEAVRFYEDDISQNGRKPGEASTETHTLRWRLPHLALKLTQRQSGMCTALAWLDAGRAWWAGGGAWSACGRMERAAVRQRWSPRITDCYTLHTRILSPTKATMATPFAQKSLSIYLLSTPLADRGSPSEFQRPCVGPARQNGGH